MNMVNAIATDQFSLMSAFEDIRGQLAADSRLSCFDRSISHWARQGDRRLPYALLRYTVRELINTPYADLAATPGIGPKKLASLIVLLRRAYHDREPVAKASLAPPPEVADQAFEADAVSESMWEAWRTTVRNHGLESQMLGQLSPSLQSLPTVIWNTELSVYLDYSLEDLQGLKTHGEKRIQAVLEVFYTVNSILEEAGKHARFRVALRPSFVLPIEQWIQQALQRQEPPELPSVRDNLTLPLLNQVLIDGGDTVHQLAAGRLGIESAPESVRAQAGRLDVTRARIYQLLDTCGEIMRVRWPEGRRQLGELAEKFSPLDRRDPGRSLFEATHHLAFPVREETRHLAEPLEPLPVQEPVAVRP